ncbi:hypothetical protein BDF19DRAFT_448189 [Syncephalis fuscata]|nr:hypothetical protein BDF19DRAFT_448189 [Syncephalis fuscata]
MPVPFEALLPLGIITGLMAATGFGLRAIKRSANEGHKPRYHLDTWDHSMMRRDNRLTGTFRGQQASNIVYLNILILTG